MQNEKFNDPNQIVPGSPGDRLRPGGDFINNVLRCTYCRCLWAEYGCSVCAARYCSVECQVKDWEKHRDICVPSLIRERSARTPLQQVQQAQQLGQQAGQNRDNLK